MIHLDRTSQHHDISILLPKIPFPQEGEVIFRHVDFGYVPEKKILQDVSVDVRPGQTIAIVP